MINTPSEDLTSLLTKKPFVRCNHEIPEIKDYQLTIQDMDGKKSEWSLYALKRFKVSQLITCMECAGNSRKYLTYPTEGLQWNNCAVSNLVYSGVLLSSLYLNLKNATEVIFVSYDESYKRSLPVDVLKKRPILLAYSLGGETLSSEHGGPLRLVVPGWYGMASVKWLKNIIISREKLEGQYQTEKYVYIYNNNGREAVTTIKPKSIITQINPQTNTIRGKAWTGNPPLKKVEVSLDGQWHEAAIIETSGRLPSASGEYGWVVWEKRLEVSPGEHRICSRAWDSTGCQPEKEFYNKYGYGNNAIQPFYFTAS